MTKNNELNNPILVDISNWEDQEAKFEIFTPKDFSFIKNANQVYGFIINNKNEVLLVAHKNKVWSIPGGHTENNETMLETLIRECYEESAAIINPKDCIPFFVQKSYTKLGEEWVFDEIQVRYIVLNAKFDNFIFDADIEDPVVFQKFFPINTLKENLKWGKTTDFVVQQLSTFINNRSK